VSHTALYTAIFLIALGVLVYLATLLRISATWIVIGALVANVVGIVWASSYTSADAPPPG